MLLGCARVSKGDEQNNALQAKALRAAGCRKLFEEAASGGRWDRPELHRMLDQLREGDTVVVWKLDRLSRSLKDVLHIMCTHCLTLNATGVGLLPHLLCYRAPSGSEAHVMRRISMSTRGELLDAIGGRYRAADRRQRSRIPDEFVAVAGYHRKHAIRLLRAEGVRADGAERASIPSDAVAAATGRASGRR